MEARLSKFIPKIKWIVVLLGLQLPGPALGDFLVDPFAGELLECDIFFG